MGAFNVDPVLTIPRRAPILSSSDSKPLDVKQGGGKVLSDSAPLPLDGLVIQSVIAKWMGTIDQWSPHLAVTRDRGYNMLHFTPLQQRGESGSPYSIYDQMAFDDALFADGSKMSVEAKQKGVKELLSRIRKEYGILSLTDVVWNHTANNSLWLEDHPEAGRPRLLLHVCSLSLYCADRRLHALPSPPQATTSSIRPTYKPRSSSTTPSSISAAVSRASVCQRSSQSGPTSSRS